MENGPWYLGLEVSITEPEVVLQSITMGKPKTRASVALAPASSAARALGAENCGHRPQAHS